MAARNSLILLPKAIIDWISCSSLNKTLSDSGNGSFVVETLNEDDDDEQVEGEMGLFA